ncbi:hypothetical protein ABPG72_004654 [Tetrahymena utriculariae]
MQNNQNYKIQYQPVSQQFNSDIFDSEVCDPLQVNYYRAKHVLGFFSQEPDLTHKNIKSWHENIIEFDQKISNLVGQYQNEQNMPIMLKELCQMYEEIRIKFDIYMKKVPQQLYQELQQQFIDNLKVMPNDLLQKNPCMCQSFNYSSQIYQKEDRQTEYKNYQLDSLQKEQYREIIKKTITSFLNSQGGTIFLGIRDFDLTVQGVDLSRKNTDELKNIVSEIKRSIEPDCSQLVNVDFIPVKKWGAFYQGKWVVRIKVAQGDLNTIYAHSKVSDKYCFESAYRDDGSCQRYELQKFMNEIKYIQIKGRIKSEPIQYVEPDPQYHLCEANEVQYKYQKYKQEIRPLFQQNIQKQQNNNNNPKKANQNQDKQQNNNSNNKQNYQIQGNQKYNQIANFSNQFENKQELLQKQQRIEQLQQQIQEEILNNKNFSKEIKNANNIIQKLEDEKKNSLLQKQGDFDILKLDLQMKEQEILRLRMQIDTIKSQSDSEKLILEQRLKYTQENCNMQIQLLEQSNNLAKQYQDQIQELKQQIQIQNQNQQLKTNISFQNQNDLNDNFQWQNNQSNNAANFKNYNYNNKFHNNQSKEFNNQNQYKETDGKNQNREYNNFNQNREQNNYHYKNNQNYNKSKNNQNYNRDQNNQNYNRDQNNQNYNRDQNYQNCGRDYNNQNRDQNQWNQNLEYQKSNNEKYQNQQDKREQIEQITNKEKEANDFIKKDDHQNNSSSSMQNQNVTPGQQPQQKKNRAKPNFNEDEKEYKQERNDSFEKKDDYDQKDEQNTKQNIQKYQKQKDSKPSNEDNSEKDGFHKVTKKKAKQNIQYEEAFADTEKAIEESKKDMLNNQKNSKQTDSQNKFDELSQIYDNDNPVMPKQNQEDLKEIEEENDDSNDDEQDDEKDVQENKSQLEFPNDIDSINKSDLEQYNYYISITFGFEHTLSKGLKIITSLLEDENPIIRASKKNIIFLFFKTKAFAKKSWKMISKKDGPFMDDKNSFEFLKLNFQCKKENTQINYNTKLQDKDKSENALIHINNVDKSKETQQELKKMFNCDSIIQALNGYLIAVEQDKLFELNNKKVKKIQQKKGKSLGIIVGTTVTLKQIENNKQIDQLIQSNIIESLLFKNVKVNKSKDQQQIILNFENQIDAYIGYQLLFEYKDISKYFQNNNKQIELECLLPVPLDIKVE